MTSVTQSPEIADAPKIVDCEVCGQPKAYENLGICLDCFKDWQRGRFALTEDQKQRIRSRMGETLGPGGEVHMERLGREDEAAECRAQALYQQR